jgi:predicted nucleic acid-binding protein
MLYLDTSLLLAALTREQRTAQVQNWLAEQPTESLMISDWVVTEFSAALSVKLRTKQLAARQRADALALFTTLCEESFLRLSVSREDFQAAARFADQYKSGLRAGDSLHLALAANHGLRLVTLDKGLARAAIALGISSELL